MPLSRLIYASENRIDPADGPVLRQLGSILAASRRNNSAQAITGALAFDSGWFLQVLEGERRAVWSTFERIAADERHGGIELIEMTEVAERVFGNWWMGLASGAGAAARPAGLRGGIRSPADMSGRQVLELMAEVSKLGLRRGVAPRAA